MDEVDTPPPLPSTRTRRSALILRGLVVGVLGLGALSIPAWRHMKRFREVESRPRPFETAEAFADAVVRAEGASNADPDVTGYRAAYELLSSERRATTTFDDFYTEWARRADEAGYFERMEPLNRGPRGSARSPKQEFRLSTAPRPGVVGGTYRLVLTMTFERDVWRVDGYGCAPEAANDAR